MEQPLKIPGFKSLEAFIVSEQEKLKPKKRNIKLISIAAGVGIIGILLVVQFGIFKKTPAPLFEAVSAPQTQDIPTQDAPNQKNTLQDIIAEVGSLVLLPHDEKPLIATILEPAKVNTQPFFAQVKKGDIVLVYTLAKKAFLYSPSSHKIINIGPVRELKKK